MIQDCGIRVEGVREITVVHTLTPCVTRIRMGKFPCPVSKLRICQDG